MFNKGERRGYIVPTRGLLLKVRELKQSTSPAIRDLAEAIERDPRSAVDRNIRDLAVASHTSASTVVRFCRKLGCAGYKEFQRELVYELASMDGVNDVAMEDITPDDEAESVLKKVLRSDVRSMEATERLLDPHALEMCADAIASCRVACLFGIGASQLVARDLESKLSRVDKDCRLHEDWHAQLLMARNMHADDVAVIVSYSGLTQEMLAIARYAHARGAKVIAITRAVGSELADEADLVLGIASSEPLIRSGAMGSRMSQLLVVDALYAVFVMKDYERCSKIMLRNFTEKKPGGVQDA